LPLGGSPGGWDIYEKTLGIDIKKNSLHIYQPRLVRLPVMYPLSSSKRYCVCMFVLRLSISLRLLLFSGLSWLYCYQYLLVANCCMDALPTEATSICGFAVVVLGFSAAFLFHCHLFAADRVKIFLPRICSALRVHASPSVHASLELDLAYSRCSYISNLRKRTAPPPILVSVDPSTPR